MVGGYEDCDRLIGDAIGPEYLFVFIKPPEDLPALEQFFGTGLSGLEARLPRSGDEVDIIGVFGRQAVDNG